ncbi:MAG: ABC-F family ATP-binding cassette domain-containing protein [Chloroflexi bacterium]|nr:ABC-F family ATP-binding cassette domain-containing protein [Chloroflexota bacterium]MCI0809763.1 ABC-F family ATP-binding cassette domain-containing protein [Chloroflexota bacterium]
MPSRPGPGPHYDVSQMRVASVNNITAQYAGQDVLKGVSFEINAGEKLGLIGANGSGKTTLLRVLLGQEGPGDGNVTVAAGTRIGYVPQYVEGEDDEFVMDWLLAGYVALGEALRRSEQTLAAAEPDDVEAAMKAYQEARDNYDRVDGDHRPEKAQKVLDSLGLEGIQDQTLRTLSGGEKNVLSLALALLDDPDFLVLDEPGNHLDFKGLAWLEEFLINFKGAVLIVSHNRHTLDRVVQGILTLEDGRVKRYEGGYSTYRATHLRELVAQQADYSANQKRLAQLEALVKRLELTARARPSMDAGKRLRARRSQLSREEAQAVEKPTMGVSAIDAEFATERTRANIVLQLRGYSKAFGDLSLLENVDLDITSGERVAIVGPNGSGKTTLLRDIVAEGAWENEVIRIGPSIRTGYAAQQQEVLDGDRTILAEMMASPPESNETVAFALLRNFLFTRDDLRKRVSDLSGGERNRLQLAALMKLKPNFLILDEPTNHLDIPAREAVEDALADYVGTILVVSHDRYFLDKVVDRVIELEDRDLVSFEGNFSEFWQARYRSVPGETGRVSTRGADRKKARVERAEQRADVASLERRIEEAEEQKLELEQQIGQAFESRDNREGRRLNRQLERVRTLLKDLYEQWAVKA